MKQYLNSENLIQRLARPIRFGLVGLSGIVVNTTILWLLIRFADLPLALASALATEVAILSNFALNDRWTFQQNTRHHSLWHRLARFNSVALGGMAITAGILSLLVYRYHIALLPANLLAIGVATGWNYLINSRWTWRTVQPHV